MLLGRPALSYGFRIPPASCWATAALGGRGAGGGLFQGGEKDGSGLGEGRDDGRGLSCIQTIFLGLKTLYGATQFCTSGLTGADPNSPIEQAEA